MKDEKELKKYTNYKYIVERDIVENIACRLAIDPLTCGRQDSCEGCPNLIMENIEANPVENRVSDDFLRELIISEFDYFATDKKKYYHIRTLIEAEDFTKFQWVDSGFNKIMTTKRFNEKYTIEKELAKNSR